METKKKVFWTADKVLSLSAMLVSVMTLVVLIYQTSLMREQQRLSVLPYLSIQNTGTGTPNYSFVLYNNGVGPAFIESVKIIYNGETYNTDLPTFLYNQIPAMDSINNIYHSNIAPGMLIPAGMEIPILTIDNSKEDAQKLMNLFMKLGQEELELELIYKSIYNERWELGDGAPIKLD